ncbi:hypothetical protein AJ78_05815 [Emergomyces pasteurianus Ep9510]|uniref:Aminoglycoside phosphotransferase domain-containing protein n=1 Tax=Emergomyces pasteurianus Ep9510 TaxID=1447872 RepID=A0A1J9QF05_9EURO|nr:hypothetical protein AJ78_05815 [Emergomyces pasteurianus Ep9510]
MAAGEMEYSVEREIDEFFKKTSTTRTVCDSYAKEHLGGDVIPVAVQGFRLKSLMLKMETVNLARTVYGHFAPQVMFKGLIGKDIDGKEPLYIYIMARIGVISYLDFLLTHNRHVPENSPTFSSWRKSLVTDIARFFAMSWKAPQNVDEISRERLLHQYERELQLLLHSLPDRFHPFIRKSLSSLQAILSLPMVLLHKDFGVCNIMVNEASCNLRLICKVHLKNGWIRYNDYILLENIFWSTFREEAGELSDETIRIIKSARVVGLLLSCGFTPRLANMSEPIPIQDDESGKYNMRNLDGLLINPATRFTELDDYVKLID